MGRRLFAIFLLSGLLAAGQSTLSLEQLTALIRSSLKLKQSDKEVAAYLRKQKLNFALSDVAIEELQGLGAGPRTVEALRELQKASRGLPPPPAVKTARRPMSFARP